MIDKELLALLGNKRKLIYINAVLGIIGLFANLATTLGICVGLYNIYNNNWDVQAYVLAIVCVVCGLIVRFVCNIISGKVRGVIAHFAKRDIRGKLYDKILELGHNAKDSLPMAGLVQLSAEGIEQLDVYYGMYLPQFFYAMSAPIVLFVITLFIEYKTALVLLACVPLIPMSIIFVSKFAKRIFAKYWDKYISMGGEFLDAAGGLKELKIFEYDAMQNIKINKSAEEFRRVTMKVLVMQLYSIMIMDLVAFGGAAAGIAVAIGSATSGTLLPFYMLFVVLTAVEFFLPLRTFGSAFHIGMNGATSGKKILKILGAKPLPWGDTLLESGIDTIRLDNVGVGYDDERRVLSNISMTFARGELVSIVGESGSGKSTIARLLIGELRASSGSVLVNDIPLHGISRDDYYSRIAFVGANSFIFNDTVRENFAVYKEDVTDREIVDSLQKMRLWDFIESNGGIDKRIAEDADNLSGGQKQRLALACALVNSDSKDVFVLDEATSNIDIESEAIIMEAVHRLRANAAVVLISHSLDNVVQSDNIYTLKDGVCIESGTHAELMDNNAQYATLYNTQQKLQKGFWMEEDNA